MNKNILLIICLGIFLSFTAHKAKADVVTAQGTVLQSFGCNPERHLGTLTAGTTLIKSLGAQYNIIGWNAVNIIPVSSDGIVTLNNDSNKKLPVLSGQDNIFIIHSKTTNMTISVDSIVCGM